MNLPTNYLVEKDGALMNLEVASGTYQFKVQYSKTTNYEYITSPIFIVNSHECKIYYHPNSFKNGIGLKFAMRPKSEEVTVSITFGLLDKCGWLSSKACKSVKMITFDPDHWDYCGFSHFMKQSEVEAHFVRDGCFTIVCSITILNEFYEEVPKRFVNGIMPYSIEENFAQLLDRKETADVRFEVEEEIFTTHRLVLAARSPVFNAELFGPMAESRTESITIKDMNPAVFKAVLTLFLIMGMLDC